MAKVLLVDINPKMIKAWRATFEENPEVEIVQGSMLEQRVDAWVTPTNAKASMDGGLDAAIKGHFGPSIEKRIQAEIRRQFGGVLRVGHATCVATESKQPAYVISTPTMTGSSEDISDTLNVALACAAAFQAVHMQNAREPGSIQSVALPGLGANTGRMPTEICADLMWTGYNLFRRRAFEDFIAMRAALEAELGELEPKASSGKVKSSISSKVAAPESPQASAPTTPSAKSTDVDFDDF